MKTIKLQKILALILATVFLVALMSSHVNAGTMEDYFAGIAFPPPAEALKKTSVAAIYKADDLTPIYEKNTEKSIAPASLTKLVTASVVLENVSEDVVFTVGSEMQLVASDSSVCGLKQGMDVSVYDLMCGLLMRSGNDAAYTLAVNVARLSCEYELDDSEAIAYFCGMMNDFAEKIGARNSCFATPDGYDAEGQYTTAQDLALIAAYAMKNETISEITSCAKRIPPFVSKDVLMWYNTNFFMNPDFPLYNDKVFGMKTGSTDDAGKCLIMLYNQNGVDYIAITTGSKTEGYRYMSSSHLMNAHCLSENVEEITCGMSGILN